MLSFPLPRRGAATRILALGAHSDDIEIGCGGTILRWLAERPDLEFCWVVFSSGRERAREARSSARLFLKNSKRSDILIKNFRTSYFPYQGARIKDFFETLKARFAPDLIFTHYRDDRHQDHRVISDLTWNTWRDHLILEYEIPKYDGDLGQPNVFVPVPPKLRALKTRYIVDVFRTQSNKAWLTEDTFRGLMRMRGVECGSPQQYAEAFYCRKLTLGE